MLEKLLTNKKDEKIKINNLENKSIINTLLPIVLNYIRMFSDINIPNFIEFKLKNKEILKKLFGILYSYKNKNNNIQVIEKDTEENIKDLLDKIYKFQIIYDNSGQDLTKLNKYDYNAEIFEQKENMEINSDKNNNNVNDKEKPKNKSKNMKNKYKNLMKKKNDLFMDKVSSSSEMIKIIDEENINQNKEKKNEIMCFYCRNPINMSSFDVPYGKLGLLIEDFFYINSIKSTIRNELSTLIINDVNKNNIYKEIIKNISNEKYNRIISCGHYFHTSCFYKGSKQKSFYYGDFTCPLCLKNENILIPPLNQFKPNYSILKSVNINEILDKNKENKYTIDINDTILFKDNIINNFILLIFLKDNNNKDYITYLNDIYPQYKAQFNFLENLFYINANLFHKHQIIDTLQNIHLCLRVSFKKDNNKIIESIINYVLNELKILAKGPGDDEYIYNKNYMYMSYINSLEKIFLSLAILFDYNEIKEIFKYIIYIYLPYFTIGYYFRDLIFKKKVNNIELNINEKMNMNDMGQYLKKNNKKMLNYFNKFLRKFALLILLIDFNNKNEHIINSFVKLNIEYLLSLIDKDNLYKLLPKDKNNEINFCDIINFIPKIFNSNDAFYNQLEKYLNHKKVFKNIFENISKHKNYYSNNININKELVIQFTPIKFSFIYLDNNVFDFIEKNLGKKCDVCNKISKHSFICLICGNKICHMNYGFHTKDHIKKCGGGNCMFVDMDNMKIIFFTTNLNKNKLFSLYVNKAGVGPKGRDIGNEFNLSHEKLNLVIKHYACNDFNFN